VPGRALPAGLLVVLSAVAALFALPGAAAATGPRSSVSGAPQAAPVTPAVARQSVLRDAREAAGRRAARNAVGKQVAGGADAGRHEAQPAPTVAPAVLAAVAWLAVLGAVGVRRVRGRVRLAGPAPVACRGRAPPAYATA
jgi:hypothetical protein